jgi:hypothetical protein
VNTLHKGDGGDDDDDDDDGGGGGGDIGPDQSTQFLI